MQASNTKTHGSSQQIANEKAYNEAKTLVENTMRTMSTSERNDELTRLSKDYSQKIDEASSYTEARSRLESEAAQIERSMQNSIQNTISSNENLMGDFVDIATRRDPSLSENEAKKLLSSRNPEDQAIKQASIREVISRNTARLSHSQPQMKQPKINKNRLNFAEDDLKQDYETKEHITQHEIDGAKDKIAAQKEEIKMKRHSTISKDGSQFIEAENEIKLGKTNIIQDGKRVREGVRKRGKDGAIVSIWTELTSGGNDDE